MQTILITGGTGFLGSKIVELFLANGYRTVILARDDSSSSRLKKFANHPGLVVVSLDKFEVEKCFSQYDVSTIIHVATCYGREREAWSEIAEANLLLPLRLLVAGEKAKVGCFINADTFFNEKILFENNENYYVETKKNFLVIAKRATRYLKMKFFNLRIEQMYGPNDGLKKFVPSIVKELLNEVENIPLTNGEQKRDFVFVNDVAQAFFNAHTHQSNLSNFEEFGIGSGGSVSIKEAVEYLKEITNSGTSLQFGKLDYRKDEIMDSHADLSNNKKIDWQAATNWREGFRQTVDFFRDIFN
ncbi:MAG: NAD(P)-dependent oxidoreductase [Patescibacteria group bacterium]|nr:NAD(P)-dependent oxidoreductase [Patescibacteria group bacterium]